MRRHPVIQGAATATIAVAALAWAMAAVAASNPPFDPDSVRLSPGGESYIDPEILQVGAKLTFQHGNGDVWLADLDPSSGLFRSPDGKQSLVDRGAYPVFVTFGGPEFGVDAMGWSIVYSKAEGDGGSPQTWRAELIDDEWSTRALTGGLPHQTQIATQSLSRTGTRVLNIRGTWQDGTLTWFSDGSPDVEHEITDIDVDVDGRTPARWARDGIHLLFRDDLGQVHLVNTDTGEARQIINHAGVHDDPNAWRAPEHDGELVVASVVDDTHIAVYRDLGGPHWTRIATLGVPSQARNLYFGSAEPVVVGGRSYISVVVKDQPSNGPEPATDGEVWMIGIEPGSDGRPSFAQRCDDGRPGVFRSDPETFIGDSEVFIYYNIYAGGIGGAGTTVELWRSRTGISVPGRTRPVVEIEDGTIRGVIEGGAAAYRGIPYAAPPTGANRFRPPQPVESWGGVRSAAFFGNPPPQYPAARATGDPIYFGDEDCLYLNVWTPSDRDPGERLPVFFFVHGGGNFSGSSSEAVDAILDIRDGPAISDGAAVAAQGEVVVVTANYRLGPLGYLAHSTLDAEAETRGEPAVSGNYGILDLVEALRWVERNIEAFGGDRRRVMLFGQSAGAYNTSVLLASPLTAGLFSSAAMHSGVASIHTRAELDDFVSDLLLELGITGSEPNLLELLRAVDPETLVTAQSAQPVGIGSFTFYPHVDGHVVDDQPYNVINRGEHAGVPFLIGTNSEEYSHRIGEIPADGYGDALQAIFGPHTAARIQDEYPLSDYDTAQDALVAVMTDKNLTCTSRRIAGWVADNQDAEVFRYHFTRQLSTPARIGDGAYHTSELLYLFQLMASGHVTTDDDDLAVQRSMLDAWVSMAAEGTPDVAWHPSWQAYDPATDPYMVIDAEMRLGDGLRTDKCDFWDGLQTTFNNPPTLLLPTEPVFVWPDRQIEITLTAHDPEGDDVDFAVGDLPLGAGLDGERGILRWRPDRSDIGEHVLAVTATDIWGASATQTMVVEVTDEPGVPRHAGGRRRP